MLTIRDLSYSVAGLKLFDSATISIPQRHKVGLVGRNGVGKSTLFKLIEDTTLVESGTIDLPNHVRIGAIEQDLQSDASSIFETVLSADTERAALMTETTDNPDRIGQIQSRLNDIDAWSAEARVSKILHGLGFETPDHKRHFSDFSGGWRMRIALAAVLFQQPDLLLLDEPTNYLDLEGTVWLENYLTRYPHTTLIISHDRSLLNRSVRAILHIENCTFKLYQGPYDQFIRQRNEQLLQTKKLAKKTEQQRAHLQKYIDRFRYKADKAKQAQSRLKALSKMKTISLQDTTPRNTISFRNPEPLNPPIISLEEVAIGYDEQCVLTNLNHRIDQDDRIALLGKNGQGKSTFAKLLARQLSPRSGKITTAKKLRVGYYAQHQVDTLNPKETPFQHIQRLKPNITPEKIRNRLAETGLLAQQVDTIVAHLSGGQKARLSLLIATIEIPHLLILDEPTNHLDIASREALIDGLLSYSGALIIISHDIHLLEHVVDRLWIVNDGTITEFNKDLSDYRRLLQRTEEKTSQKPTQKNRKYVNENHLNHLRSSLRTTEKLITKLEKIRKNLEEKLADPDICATANSTMISDWHKKHANIIEKLNHAEHIWMTTAEQIESRSAK